MRHGKVENLQKEKKEKGKARDRMMCKTKTHKRAEVHKREGKQGRDEAHSSERMKARVMRTTHEKVHVRGQYTERGGTMWGRVWKSEGEVRQRKTLKGGEEHTKEMEACSWGRAQRRGKQMRERHAREGRSI